jgi:hypothetical protein
MEKNKRYKDILMILGLLQLLLSYPLNGTVYMPIFGTLSILWVVIAFFYPPIIYNN